VGLPVYQGIRRTPGLRREELATLAGISNDYYTRLERGKETHPSPEVIDALARALQLENDERDHLRSLAALAARRASTPPPPPSRTVPAGMAILLDNGRLTNIEASEGWKRPRSVGIEDGDLIVADRESRSFSAVPSSGAARR
jgi:transcriptional regulator with XRE-family HTH domain